MNPYRTLVATLVFASGMALLPKLAGAANFRVENSVFAEGETEPVSRSVTIFQAGLVYDFLSNPGEVIIFNKADRRFILLDMDRRVRSEISMDDVRDFVNRVKQRMAGHPSLSVRWLADPVFEESYNAERSELTLKSPSIVYQAQLKSTDPAVAAQYHEFSDWYARFNLALDPKSRPPFPRMMLNDAIDRHQGIAKEVHLTSVKTSNGTSSKVTSRHEIALQLDSADTNRTAEVKEYLHSFRSVSFTEYQNPAGKR
jgi:hypothetical protein